MSHDMREGYRELARPVTRVCTECGLEIAPAPLAGREGAPTCDECASRRAANAANAKQRLQQRVTVWSPRGWPLNTQVFGGLATLLGVGCTFVIVLALRYPMDAGGLVFLAALCGIALVALGWGVPQMLWSIDQVVIDPLRGVVERRRGLSWRPRTCVLCRTADIDGVLVETVRSTRSYVAYAVVVTGPLHRIAVVIFADEAIAATAADQVAWSLDLASRPQRGVS